MLNEAVVVARVAEQSGFDSCLFSEHHQQADGYIRNNGYAMDDVLRKSSPRPTGPSTSPRPTV